jgi:RND family efflux transporter MFP subunit
MDNSRVRFERYKASGTSTSREEVEDRLTDYRVAAAELENQMLIAKTSLATIALQQEASAIARQQLADTSIRVPNPTQPVPGVEGDASYAITHRAVAEGSLVKSGMEVFTLVIEQPLKLRAPVPERHTGEVKLAQEAQVYTAAYADPFTGKVTRINPAIDRVNRTFEVEILVPNREGKLKPGGFAKVAILTQLDSEALTVPLEAPITFAGVTKIFVVENGRAKDVPVELGMQGLEWVEVTAPKLPKGTQVVTSGQSALADGTPVTIRNLVAVVSSEPSTPSSSGPGGK